MESDQENTSPLIFESNCVLEDLLIFQVPLELRGGWHSIFVSLIGKLARASQMTYLRADTSTNPRICESLKSITIQLSVNLISGCFHRLSLFIYWYT